MRVLLQRVTQASVSVDGVSVAAIGAGLLVLVGVEQNDTEAVSVKLADKTLDLRIFADAHKPMNRSVLDVGGDVLVVSQFTLAADTRKGKRPGFSTAAAPDIAQQLFNGFVTALQRRCANVQQGVFGADMQVALVNDGPVTFVLDAA